MVHDDLTDPISSQKTALETTRKTQSIPEPDGERTFGGHAHLLDLDAPIDSMGKLADKYGEIYKLKFPGGAELVVVSSQELIAELCDESRFDKMVSGALYKIRDFAFDGLFTAHTREDNWQRAHQLLTPAFSMGSMQDYFPKMLDVTQQLCDRWQRLNHSDAVDVPDEMVRLTLEVIGLCGFDYRFDSFGREDAHPFVAAMGMCLGEAMARSVRLPIFTKLAVNKNRAYEASIEYMNSVVDTVIKERKATGKVGQVGDLLDLMLESQREPASGLSDENIRYQIITFLIAGHETTSGLLAFTLNHLLKHPAVMTRARAEVDRVFGHDLSTQPTLRDVAGLAYIRQILNEALRLHPTAPAMQLTPFEDTVIGGKYKVGKGYPILALTTRLHRDAKVWGENAHLFNPENFAPAREKDRPPHSFKPFGNGQRACIGSQFALQESTLVIGMMLQRFNLVDHTNYQLRIKETLTFKPDNFFLQVRKRSEADREEVLEAADHQFDQDSGPTLVLRKDHHTPLTILYGSNMGSARQIALRLADEGEGQGYTTTLATLDESVNSLPQSGVLLVVCASYNGQPPDNAEEFFKWLEAEVDTKGNASLINDELRFAVLGVGNQDWATTYQRVPRLLDDWLERAGGGRLLPRGEADARSDFFGQVDDFVPQAWRAAAVSFDLRDTSGTVPGPTPATSRYRVEALHHGAQEQRFPDMQSFEVVENDCMAAASEAFGEAKHHLSLRLPDEVTYKTGDHLLVMPSNRSLLVQRVAKRFSMPLDQKLAVMRNTPGDDPLPIGQELTVAELLTHYIELQDPLSLRILGKLVGFIGCPNRRAEAESLAENSERFEREVQAPRVSLLQYLEATPECELPFELFLEYVTPMRPRYYSISSSALVEPRSVDLTISVLNSPQSFVLPSAAGAEAGTQTMFAGSCSHYLAEREKGSTVTARVRAVDSHFLPPSDLATPIIMIGPGTGVAPFRGFLQDRLWHQQNGTADLGAAMLFFGCRHPEVDFMYRDELERAHRDSLVELSVAYSRLGGDPLPTADYSQISGYVQNAIEAEGDRVWHLLERGAVVYVCGDAAKMLPDVRRSLAALAQKYDAGMAVKTQAQASAEADEWLADLESSARFLVDAWA